MVLKKWNKWQLEKWYKKINEAANTLVTAVTASWGFLYRNGAAVVLWLCEATRQTLPVKTLENSVSLNTLNVGNVTY